MMDRDKLQEFVQRNQEKVARVCEVMGNTPPGEVALVLAWVVGLNMGQVPEPLEDEVNILIECGKAMVDEHPEI